MRKMLMLLFVMMMLSILAVPAFAQTGGNAAPAANWVATAMLVARSLPAQKGHPGTVWRPLG